MTRAPVRIEILREDGSRTVMEGVSLHLWTAAGARAIEAYQASHGGQEPGFEQAYSLATNIPAAPATQEQPS